MSDSVTLPASRGAMTVHIETPDGDGPWPVVLVISDALGMTSDVIRQARWLADEGYLAVAPDLFYWGGRVPCLFSTMRQAVAREGQVFEDLETVRLWALGRSDTTDRVGVIGFCLGGGLALLLAARGGYDASSVNYGDVPSDALTLLEHSCPIVGSYGALDPTLKVAPRRLAGALRHHGIDNDVAIYANAGHAFINDHDDDEVPRWAVIMGRFSHSEHHAPSAVHARARITAFFDRHLAVES